MCMSICIYVMYTMCVSITLKRSEEDIGTSYGLLWTTMWVMRTEPCSSARAASALNGKPSLQPLFIVSKVLFIDLKITFIYLLFNFSSLLRGVCGVYHSAQVNLEESFLSFPSVAQGDWTQVLLGFWQIPLPAKPSYRATFCFCLAYLHLRYCLSWFYTYTHTGTRAHIRALYLFILLVSVFKA